MTVRARARLLAALGFSLGLLLACAERRPPGVQGLEHAERALHAVDGTYAWEPVSLPDRWKPADHADAREAVYRATFLAASRPREVWGVLLPEVRMNAEIWVNGASLGNGGRLAEPIARNWNRPLYFAVPAELLRNGANALRIRLVTSATSEGRLAPIAVGPDRLVRARFERLLFWKVAMREVSIALLAASALMAAFVSLRWPAERDGVWFAAGLALLAFAQTDAIVRDLPLGARAWQLANTAAYLTGAYCLTIGAHRRLRVHAPRVEAGLGAVLAAVFGTAVALPATILPSVTLALLFFMALLGGEVIRVVVRYAPRARRAQLAALGGSAFAIGVHDLQAAFTGWSFSPQPLVSYFGFILAAFGAWQILDHLLEALRESERLNADLDKRVSTKHAELESSYARMRALEVKQAHADEREHLLREMHDGVGGHLVTTLALVEARSSPPERISEALRDAIDEMRLMLDSLEVESAELLSILANLRARFEPRLANHALRIRWSVDPAQRFPNLEPLQTLHVMRVVQEAIHNAVRHSQGTTITIRTGDQILEGRAGAFIEVADDGGGMQAPSTDTRHRGLANMRRRARELRGELAIESGLSGTIVRLWLPFHGA